MVIVSLVFGDIVRSDDEYYQNYKPYLVRSNLTLSHRICLRPITCELAKLYNYYSWCVINLEKYNSM